MAIAVDAQPIAMMPLKNATYWLAEPFLCIAVVPLSRAHFLTVLVYQFLSVRPSSLDQNVNVCAKGKALGEY